MGEIISIDGACHCGAITYQARIDPDHVSICHCTDCQTLGGTAFRVSAFTAPDQIQVQGQPKIYVKIAESGRRRLQHFCGTCGTSLFSSSEADRTAGWGIRWGSIRERDQLAPKRQIWRRSAPAWICAFDDMPATQTD